MKNSICNKSTTNITLEKRLEIIRENISAFSDYMDKTRQMSNIPDDAWNYIIEIEKAVGGIWKDKKGGKA